MFLRLGLAMEEVSCFALLHKYRYSTLLQQHSSKQQQARADTGSGSES